MILDEKYFVRLRILEDYFKDNIKNNISFEVEYLAAKEINEQLQEKEIDKQVVKNIVNIYNKANEIDHFNGSGWYDLELHICHLAKTMGVSITKDEKRSIVIKEE
jgi:hypothetical protein